MPFPFWVYGGAMTVFGRGLATAEWVAVLLGVAGSVALYALGRWMGLRTIFALGAALLGACIPHAAYYGAAMVPDYPTAVLALIACVTLAARTRRPRLVGATCALAATLSRYETWPIALIVTLYALLDWVHASKPGARASTNAQLQTLRSPGRPHWLLCAALIAPSGALTWMIHGATHHGDALFFLKRVAAYRRALNEPSLPLAERLLKEPLLLLRGEPELVALVLCLLLVVVVTRRSPSLQPASLNHGSSSRARGRYRPAVGLLSLVAFLTLGDILDGAPTHHEDRVLLPVWLGLALLAGVLVDRLLSSSSSRLGSELPSREGLLFDRQLSSSSSRLGSELPSRERQGPRSPLTLRMTLLGLALTVAAVACFVRPRVVKDEPFVDRSHELAIGRIAASRIAPNERVAVYTTDYGYFAVQAAMGRPRDGLPLMRHDPRTRELDPFSSPDELATRLDALGARYLIVPAEHRPKAAGFNQIGAVGRFQLLDRN